jgi:hypothetical protein
MRNSECRVRNGLILVVLFLAFPAGGLGYRHSNTFDWKNKIAKNIGGGALTNVPEQEDQA